MSSGQTNVAAPEEGTQDQSLFGEEVSPIAGNTGEEEVLFAPGYFEEVPQDGKVAEDNDNKTDNDKLKDPVPWIDPTKPDMTVDEAAAHWKKRHTDSQRYIEDLKHKVDEYGDVNPEYLRQLKSVESLLRENPDVLDTLYNRVAPGEKEETPRQRQAVQVPDFYDPQDAYDPRTRSGEWRLQQEQTRFDQMASQFGGVINEAFEKRDQAAAAAEAEKTRREEAEGFYKENGVAEEDRARFEDFLSRGPGRDITIEDKYLFYKAISGDVRPGVIEGKPNPVAEKINQIQQARRLPSADPPPGALKKEMTDEEAFTEGLKQNSKPRWTVS